MFKVIQTNQTTIEAIADKVEDMATAPKHYGAGSSCLVIGESSLYMLDSTNTWVEM